MSRITLAAAITHGLISVGHTVHGFNTFPLPQWKSLPTLLYAYARVGWYQGSAFFAIAGLYTYQLSQRPPSTWTPIDRAISAMTVAIYWFSSAWYLRNGDKPTSALTAIAGAVQALALAQ